MNGLGSIKMKGKLTQRVGCGCCFDFVNTKKTSLYNDKSYKSEAETAFTEHLSGIDITIERPDIVRLFPGQHVRILANDPYDEAVVYVDLKFYGLIEQYDDYFKTAQDMNRQWNNVKDLENIYQDYINHIN